MFQAKHSNGSVMVWVCVDVSGAGQLAVID